MFSKREIPNFTSSLTKWEAFAAIIYMPVHLGLLPLILSSLLLQGVLNSVNANFLCYAVGTVYMLLALGRFLRREFDPLCDAPLKVASEIAVSYLLMMCFNMCVNLFLGALSGAGFEAALDNPNNQAVFAMADESFGVVSAMTIFLAPIVEELMFRGEVHDWVDEDAAMFGWVPNDEGQDVTVASQYGQFTIPSDHSLNTTVFACKNAFGEADFKQNAKETEIKAEQGKHYVCIMMSDGDNVQMWYNGFADNSKYFGAEKDNTFPMGWSIQPALLELGPNVMNYVKRNAGEKDYFVASVSGIGYIYPQVYPTLDTYTKALSAYLRRADLSVVQILDSGPSQAVVEAYAKIPELKGAIYCYGDRYAAGNGSVYWSNGKPFVSIRETLWNANVESMAERINGYSKDPTTIEGYTAINLHPWSMSYQDAVKLVSLLDENVVVVSADDFIRLITENVPHEDVVR